MTARIRIATIALLVIVALPIASNEFVFWGLTLAILAFVRFVERRPLSSIGLRAPTWRTLLFGVLGGIVMLASLAFIYDVIYPLAHAPSDIGPTSVFGTLPGWLNAEIVVRAAVFEEIFYRGFAIERLTELLRSRPLAALISWAAFTLAHLPSWGWLHLIVAGTGGAILTALYLWRRDLPCCMIAHALTDGVGVLLA
jgi:uncharacterized protein